MLFAWPLPPPPSLHDINTELTCVGGLGGLIFVGVAFFDVGGVLLPLVMGKENVCGFLPLPTAGEVTPGLTLVLQIKTIDTTIII